MKKWMLIISIAFFMSLTACDNTDEPDNENKDEPNDPIETITISFETNGGSTLSALTLEEGSSLSEPNDPSKPGYTFRGWSTSRYALDPFDFDASLESNMTLYAHWQRVDNTPTAYTVSFNSNGGSNVSPVTFVAGENVSEPSSPVRNGYDFEGWYEDSGLNTLFEFTSMPGHSLTLYAKWDPSSATSPTTYTLSFNSNGGTSVSSITEESGTAISAPQSPSKNGYSFVGWYEDSALTTPFTFDTMPSTSKTLYAKWEATQTNPTLYTLSFNSNGGSIHSPLSLEGGATIPDLPTPSKTNFTFEGWFMDVQLTTPFTSSTMPSSNVTLYAKWESEPTIDDLLVGSLESDDYGFECISGICTLNLASNVYYEYSVASKTFSFTSLEDTVENGYYRVKNETLSIDSSWDVDYSYELEENYGIFYNVDFEYSGNAQTTSYSVAKYDSNYTSEATLISNAENRITQLKGLIDAIFDTIEDTEFEDLN